MRRLYAVAAMIVATMAGGGSVAHGATCYAVMSLHQVLTFQTGSPSTVQNSVALSGLALGEVVVGCGVRPADGKFYILALGGAGVARLYTVVPSTGVATPGAYLNQTLSGFFLGMDFNPVADRIRLVSDSAENLRVNPTTGDVTVDTPIAYAAGDPNSGTFPALFSIGYSNNVAGAGSTALFGIDSGTDALVLQNPPTAGTLNTVGSLGSDVGGVSGFDVAPSPVSHAYAALTVGGASRLYFVDLATGHATEVGVIGTGELLAGFTIAPGYPQTAFNRQQTIRVVSNGVGYQELSYNYTTGEIFVTPYSATSGAAARLFPFSEWSGVFHYDFGAAAFTQAVYSRQHPL